MDAKYSEQKKTLGKDGTKMTMDKTPLYIYPMSDAQERGELEVYQASRKATIACKNAIDAAIIEHYQNYCLHSEAVKQVVAAFGYDRVFYVLAVTVRALKRDGRLSSDNKDWACTIPVYADLDSWGRSDTENFVLSSHPGLINSFLNVARHEYLLTLPLTKEDIKAEALKLLSKFQNTPEPNSPEGTHFMAQISQDFLIRAKPKDHGRLIKELPFPSLSLSTFAIISKDEDRFHPPCRRRASSRDKR